MKESLTPAEAQAIILDETPLLGPERTSLAEALGRILCEPIHAPRDLPPADNSAMDGYALRSADVKGATREAPALLEVTFTVPAGATPDRSVEPGCAARILTGAPVPAGADSVVKQEDTERDGDRLRVLVSSPRHDNIRDAGEDVRAGDEVLSVGKRIGPAEIGMLASLGRTVVAVHQRPRVAILSSGDELVEPDGDIGAGRIVSSNSYSIAAQCRESGALPVYVGIAKDTAQDLERHFRAALRADVVVSSAGVSVGDRDYVRSVLEKLGCSLLFWGVKIKPGYPLAFGRFSGDTGPLVFGLPGNPVSAMMTFEQFVRPALRKMTGSKSWFRPLIRARLRGALRKKSGRLHFVRVRLERSGDEVFADTTGNQSSGVLRSMTRAHGLLIFPADATQLCEDDTVDVQVLDGEFFDASTPGF